MRTYSRKKPECEVIDGVKDMCRLCLSKSEEVVPIYSQECDEISSSLSTRIMICVGLEMIQDDCLPNIICSNCNTELEKCYKFRKMCEKTYQKLKIHLQSCKINEYKKNVALTEKKIDSSDAIVMRDNGNAESIKTNIINSLNDVDYICADKSDLVLVFNENNVEIENIETDVIETNYGQRMVEVDVNTCHEILNTEVVDSKPLTCQKNYAEVSQSTEQIETKSNSHIIIEAAPKIAKYISNELVETGILMLHDDRLELPHDMNTILELVTEDGYMVTMHLDETDDQEDAGFEANLCVEYDVKNIIEGPHSILDLNKRMQVRNSPRSKNNALDCLACGKRFARRSALQRHARAHVTPRAFACARCGRRFAQKEVMKRHELVHEEKRPFACPECPKSFTQRSGLVAHARTHAAPHARALTLHSCTLCTKIFLYASGLSRHMKTHSGRVYTCGDCNRPFKDKSSLRRHLKANHHRPANPPKTAQET